jgi:uncharacterized Ntn-hydrolase superfamily protein
MKLKIPFAVLLIISSRANAQEFFSSPFAHTFSIVARDSVTGEMGVAVQSHWFSVGSIVGWGEAGVGVIATQSFVNPAYGPDGLKLLREGKSPEEVVRILTETDSGRDVRQLAVLDTKGRTASYTGKKCIIPAGNIARKNFSVQANLMLNDKVWPAMAKAFEETTGPLVERIIAALEAAQAAGGDIRGMQSASILIVKGKSTGKIWEDREIDLRVEDNLAPIDELKRLLKIYRAYEHMNNGDLAMEKKDMAAAMNEYGTGAAMYSENPELKYWYAVTMVNNGKVDEALPLFKEVFLRDSNWALLIPRLRNAEQLKCSDEVEKKILEQAAKH